jgi:hypothetical protein
LFTIDDVRSRAQVRQDLHVEVAVTNGTVYVGGSDALRVFRLRR